MNRLESKMFFICGAPKSGTTWLQRSMNSHPEIVCKGEGHFIEKLVLPMAAVFREYNAKLNIVSNNVYNGNPYYKTFSSKEFYDFCHGIIVNRISEGESKNASFFGDKTPRYYEFINNLKNIYPSCKIICILRDPRDLAVSSLYHAHRAGVKDIFTNGSGTRRAQINLTTQQFVRCVKNISDAKVKYSDDIIITSYEKLISDNIAEMKNIFSFIGASSDGEVVKDIVNNNSFLALTNREAGEMDKNSFMRKGIVGDWVNEITEEEEHTIRENVTSKVHVDYFS